MNKEQIQQKFKDYLTDRFPFYPDRTVIGPVYFEDLLNVMEVVFNLGLETAADNAEADFNIVGEWNIVKEGEIKVYVLKESILKFKL